MTKLQQHEKQWASICNCVIIALGVELLALGSGMVVAIPTVIIPPSDYSIYVGLPLLLILEIISMGAMILGMLGLGKLNDKIEEFTKPQRAGGGCKTKPSTPKPENVIPPSQTRKRITSKTHDGAPITSGMTIYTDQNPNIKYILKQRDSGVDIIPQSNTLDVINITYRNQSSKPQIFAFQKNALKAQKIITSKTHDGVPITSGMTLYVKKNY